MTLNTSGPISLNGPVVGQSIALELNLSANVTIGISGPSARSLAGVPTGPIAMPANFYGKSNAKGTWTTASGSIGQPGQTRAFSTTVVATVNTGTPVYSLVSGSFPSGISLNTSTGVISGTTSAATGTYNFTLGVRSSAGSVVTNRAFSLTVVPVPVWNTAAGYIGRWYTQQSASYSLSAQNTISYSLVSGSLPPGWSLNTSNGVLSGTAPAGSVADYSVTNYSFTVRANGNYSRYTDRTFNMNIRSRYIGYQCFYATENNTISGSVPANSEGYRYNRMLFSSYGTPPGTCPNYSISGCNSGSSNGWTGPIGQTSFSVGATNSNWGDPCGGTVKWMKLIINYGHY